MNKEQAAMIEKEAERLYPFIDNDTYFKRLGYIAGRTVGIERERELEEEVADLKRQLEKYETDRYDKDDDDYYDPDKDRDDPRNNQTFGGKY